jgi:hypothetical protein
MVMKIDWHGFLAEVVAESRKGQESCAWLFAEKPFCMDDIIHVVEVTNVGLKSHGNDVRNTFAPDKKEFARVKQMAKKSQYTKIGNVHTHVVIGTDLEAIKAQREPSEEDLKFARRFNDVIRGIIVVVFPADTLPGQIDSIVWHDQYGQKLELELEAVISW